MRGIAFFITVLIHPLLRAEVPLQWPAYERTINAIAFSPDGKRIATASDEDTLKIWDITTGKELLSIAAKGQGIAAIAWHPNGKQIATGHWNKTIGIWNAENGKLIQTLTGHKENILALAYDADGSRIASGSGDDTLKLWNAETGKAIQTIDSGNEYDITAVCFSPDGSRSRMPTHDWP